MGWYTMLFKSHCTYKNINSPYNVPQIQCNLNKHLEKNDLKIKSIRDYIKDNSQRQTNARNLVIQQ